MNSCQLAIYFSSIGLKMNSYVCVCVCFCVCGYINMLQEFWDCVYIVNNIGKHILSKFKYVFNSKQHFNF